MRLIHIDDRRAFYFDDAAVRIEVDPVENAASVESARVLRERIDRALANPVRKGRWNA